MIQRTLVLCSRFIGSASIGGASLILSRITWGNVPVAGPSAYVLLAVAAIAQRVLPTASLIPTASTSFQPATSFELKWIRTRFVSNPGSIAICETPRAAVAGVNSNHWHITCKNPWYVGDRNAGPADRCRAVKGHIRLAVVQFRTFSVGYARMMRTRSADTAGPWMRKPQGGKFLGGIFRRCATPDEPRYRLRCRQRDAIQPLAIELSYKFALSAESLSGRGPNFRFRGEVVK